MPADRRAAIFDSFEQGDGSHARQFEGAGLGLAISRELVRRMGGELTLADNPEGGSIFAFAVSLPESAAVEPAGAVEARAQSLEGARALIIAHSPFEAPAIGERLMEAGVSVERADGLSPGLKALSRVPAPISSSSIALSGLRRPIAWRRLRAQPASSAACSCSLHSNGGLLDRPRSRASTAGW